MHSSRLLNTDIRERIVPDWSSWPSRASSGARALARQRSDRPWCALVVVPMLVLVAVLTVQLWALVPLVGLMCWWASTETSWLWILAVVESAWGVQWVLGGTYLLATFPEDRGTVAVVWITYALLVAGVGAVNRIRFKRQYGL